MEALLSYSQVQALIPLSKRQIQRLVASGQFPKPCKIGRVTMFFESDVQAYIESLRETQTP